MLGLRSGKVVLGLRSGSGFSWGKVVLGLRLRSGIRLGGRAEAAGIILLWHARSAKKLTIEAPVIKFARLCGDQHDIEMLRTSLRMMIYLHCTICGRNQDCIFCFNGNHDALAEIRVT